MMKEINLQRDTDNVQLRKRWSLYSAICKIRLCAEKAEASSLQKILYAEPKPWRFYYMQNAGYRLDLGCIYIYSTEFGDEDSQSDDDNYDVCRF
jgi:hypothetical protein